ncbi:MAG: ABC transporter substrate-binding protein [Candidatus Heimdallarchaeota archaeon]
MNNKLRRKTCLVSFFLLILIPLTLFYSKYSEVSADANPFFELDILMPNSSAYTPPYHLIWEENLEQIGVAIDTLDWTGWAQISPRTWGHPGPYPIPDYNNGGYDVLILGWGFGFDYTPLGLFDSASITPINDNFYQYDSPEMDWAIYNFTNAFIEEDKVYWGNKIQEQFYQDMPAIPLISRDVTFVFDENLTGWDGTLWENTQESVAPWFIPGQTNFTYAVPADFEDFHIYYTESVYDDIWLNQIYDGLIERQSGNYSWGPAIASHLETTNGLNWTVTIDSNAVWADGTPLTAHDVNYSYGLQLLPGYSHDYNYWTEYLDNESIVLLDNHTLEFNFKKPYTFQETNLALDIIPKHIWSNIDPIDHESQAITWATNDPTKLFGSGPFYLFDYDSTNHIIHMKRNPYYANFSNYNEANFEDFYVKFYSNRDTALSAFANSEIDMIDSRLCYGLSDIIDGGYHYETVKTGFYREIAINNMHPVFGTGEKCPIASPESAKYVRTALSYIYDRQKLIDDYILTHYGNATLVATPFCQLSPYFNESILPHEFSIEKARYYMELAGYIYPEVVSYISGYNWIYLLSVIGLLGFWFIKKITFSNKQ